MAINARSVITRLSLWLLITSGTPIQAQDICSVDGKKKLQAAEVSSAQIAKICPPTAQGGRLDQVHYREVKAAILDAHLHGVGMGGLDTRRVVRECEFERDLSSRRGDDLFGDQHGRCISQ